MRSLGKSFLITRICVLVTLAPVAFAAPVGWFEWPSVEPQPGSALDASALNSKPAGALGRVVVRDGQFATANGGRLRFWGANLSSGENFPDADSATRMARRLAKAGINIVRLHHLDNNWSVASRGSIWSPDDPRRITVDAQQLDKLHRLIAALKAEGIYANVNLKVSRTFSAADGFPESVTQTPSFNKRVDYFQRRMIELQKDYARQILTTKNPYTGLTLVEDPAVAIVEINNENSLLGMRTRDVGRGLEQLPEPFRGELAQLWNEWLLKKYRDDATLAAAWNQRITPVGEQVISPQSRWYPDAQIGNAVVVLGDPADPSMVHFRVAVSDRIRWRAAAYLDRLELKDGETYSVSFSARADSTRPVQVAIGRDEAGWRTDKWRTRGLNATVDLTPEWKTFRYVINAHSVVDVGSRFTVIAGHALGDVWLKDLRIESGAASAGVPAGQTLAARSLSIPTEATPVQWNDWLTFLVDTEKAYVDEMRAYLRGELKVQSPIVCSQANYGGIAGLEREKASDFIDAHSYWQHPDFGGLTGGWDLGNFTVNNSPQLSEYSPRWFGELGGIALLRVSGKPFSVTEIDNPAPSDYACEMYPLLATFASVQDWDALYPFDIVGLGDATDSGAIRTFFDQNHHPAKWGFGPFATRVFREELVPRAESRRELLVRAPVWAEANHVDVLWLRLQPNQALGFLSSRLSVNEQLLAAPAHSHVERTGTDESTLARMRQMPRGPVYTVSAARAAAIVGFVGGASIGERDLSLTCDSFGLNFGAVTAVTLDDRPISESARVLVTLAARAENQGVVWNQARTSIGESWGHGPTIAERVPATVRLRVQGSRRVFALAPDGSRGGEIDAQLEDGWLVFSTRSGPPSLHYEVVSR